MWCWPKADTTVDDAECASWCCSGIITNHGALKQFLAAHGAPPFLSDTDSEVIPKLCKWLYDSMPERVPLSQVGCSASHLHPHLHMHPPTPTPLAMLAA